MKYKIVKKDFGVKTPDIREVAVVEDIDALEALPRGSAIVFMLKRLTKLLLQKMTIWLRRKGCPSTGLPAARKGESISFQN